MLMNPMDSNEVRKITNCKQTKVLDIKKNHTELVGGFNPFEKY